MELQPNQPTKKQLPPVLRIFIIVLALCTTGFGVYTWQQRGANQKQQTLQAQIDALNRAEQAPVEYKSRIGGLTLKLPPQYVILVNVDGNKGGAPGTTLRVGEVESRGVISDNVYRWVEVEVGTTGRNDTLDQRAELVNLC